MGSVEVDRSDYDELVDHFEQVGPDFIEYATIDFWTVSTEEAPIRKGTLRGSIQYNQQDLYTWIVGTALEYAPAVHDGSKPHLIEAKNAKALGPITMTGTYLGVSKSGYGFFKSVQHPGYGGDPFFTRAQETIEGQLEIYLDQAMAFNGLS